MNQRIHLIHVLFFFLGSCRWSETNAWIKDLHSSSWRKQKLVNHLQVQTKHTICLLKHTSNSVTGWRDLNIAASSSALLPFPSLSIIWSVQTQLVRIFGTHWSQHVFLVLSKDNFIHLRSSKWYQGCTSMLLTTKEANPKSIWS